MWSNLVHTSALQVDTATPVAEFLATSASHVVTAFGFLNPKFAEGTHLVLGTLHKFLESLFILVWICRCLILYARLTSMEGDSALKTVSFGTLDASEIIAVHTGVKDESVIAISGWAP